MTTDEVLGPLMAESLALRLRVEKLAVRQWITNIELHRMPADGLQYRYDGMIYELVGLVLCGPKHSRVVELEVRVPATWWDSFKLAAIEAGNPFFDPAKVRYRTIRDRRVVTYSELLRDPPLLPRDGQRGFIVEVEPR